MSALAYQNPGIGYRREIDGLRAVAVMAVIFYHARIFPFASGYVGVDIFFVISGYLITSIIRSDIEHGKFSLLQFYDRRIRRIFPALFVVLAISTALAAAIYTPRQFKEFGQSLIATATFTSNIYFPMKLGYFAEDAEHVALLHMWSLSVEEQFYIVFPLLLFALRKLSAKAITIILAVIAALSLGWAVAAPVENLGAHFFWTHTRAWELLAGALVAVNNGALQRAFGDRVRLRVLLECGGAAVVLASIFFVPEGVRWPGVATIPVVFGTVLIVAASTATTPVGRLLGLRPMVGIGLMSYSAYLWHQPLFAFARVAAERELSLAETAGLIAVTLGLAWLSLKFIETPFRRTGKYVRARVLMAGASASVLASAVGAGLYLGQGLPWRYDAATRTVAETMAPSPFRDKCHTDGANYIAPERACRYFFEDADWAVFSDSEGVELAYALAEMQRPLRRGVVHLTFSGCPAALTYVHPGPGCNAWTNATTAWLEHNPRVSHVLIVYRWSYHLFGDQLKTFPKMPGERPKFLFDLAPDAAREQFWKSFVVMVDRLRNAGKTVVIVRPIPDLPVAVERYVYARSGAATKTGMTRMQADVRNAWTNQKLDTLEGQANIRLIDPAASLCDARDCASIKDGKALYIDDNHPSLIGARKILADAAARGLLR